MKLVRLSAILLFASFVSLQCQAQCTSGSLNGTLFYFSSGTIKSGTATLSYAQLATLIANGNGALSGQTTISTAGVLATLPLSGTYAIQANCSGTATLSTSANTAQLTLQLINGGGTTLSSVAESTASELSEGRFYRAANANGGQCSNGSLTGGYSALLSGGTYASSGVRTTYNNVNQTVFNGQGGLTISGEVTTGSASGSPLSGSGTYSISANCSGVAQINTPSGQLNYLLAYIEGGALLYLENDATTTISGSADPQLVQDILPQFAFGGGWYSALYFTNNTSLPVSFPVTFTTDGAAPMAVPGVGASTQITVAPLGTAIIEAQNVGTLTEVYATFALPAGVTGYGVFRQSITGVPNQEAVVGFKDANATESSLTFDDTNYITSVAIVNPSNVAATVNITLWDNNGNMIGTSAVPVQPLSKTANVLRAYPGLAGIVGLRGLAQFSVTTGNVSVLGLRSNGPAITSIPTVEQ